VSTAAGELVARTRRVAGDLPICVGLGVSNGDQAAEVAGFADGVIVGSAYVRQMLDGRGAEGVRALSAELADGVRRAGARA
jgi:tryptophan synthase alpha chain